MERFLAFVRNLKQASVAVKYKEKGDEGKEKVNHTQSCRTSEKRWGAVSTATWRNWCFRGRENLLLL